MLPTLLQGCGSCNLFARRVPAVGVGVLRPLAPDTVGSVTDSTKPADAPSVERTPDQIQADIDSAQQRLADQVDELSDRLAPQSLAEDAIGGVKKVFVEEDGTPKAKPIAIVAGTLTALVVLRKIFHRG
jgi:Protein of unknown function (DUF3618)